MDWKYILSMAEAADDLEEAQKDELLNTIAWYDFSNDKVDMRKHAALLRICQVIMKYKSEQVEALFAELDELAVKQAEEEAKTRDSDERSSKSKRSLDSDEQDMRFRDLKTKYRKLQKHIDDQKEENEKLNQNVKMLEQERVYLQKELRNSHNRDDSASDISETVKDQQRSLMDNVQQKNAQISQLLTDIENVESDNLQLRAQLSSVRDDLSDATEKIETILEENSNLKNKLETLQESNSNLSSLLRDCKHQVDDLLEEKKRRELEFEQFAKEIDTRVEHWKNVLDGKNREIDQLKSKTKQSFTVSHPISGNSAKQKTGGPVELCIDETQIVELQKTLVEREENIVLLQKQLEKATKEMLKSAQVLKNITKERDVYGKKCEKINSMARDLRKQLKGAHQRSQVLVEDIRYQEKLLKEKDNDINDLVKKIEEPNLKKVLKELEQVKGEKRNKEKKIADLVRNCNKLQSFSDNFEKENVALRDRLGLTEDDFVNTKCFNSHQKRNKKLMEDLRNKLETCEEEKLQYRMELQKLSKIISNLSDQLLDLGETPIVEGQEINVSNLRSDSKDQDDERTENISKSEYNTLLEENDALRKGLHEILDSMQSKQAISPRELKSETLESLLRALDAKHVSGWYHPAMRMQAEVHTLQGSNATLREQLRLARKEIEVYREKSSQIITLDSSNFASSNANVIAKLNNHLIDVLKRSNYSNDEETNTILVQKLESFKKEFLNVQEQLGVLYNQYIEEKQTWESDLAVTTEKLKEMEANNVVMECKLSTIQLLTNPVTEEDVKIKTTAESVAQLAIMNRKFVFMDNLEKRYKNEINSLRNSLLEGNKNSWKTMNELKEINLKLTQRVKMFENSLVDKVIPEDFAKLQNDNDTLLLKNRDLQRSITEIQEMFKNDLEHSQKKIQLLEDEKRELVEKCVQIRRGSTSDDDLQAKLAQSHINETTERQRANHTNSLYELVKEQLSKSEERHREYQKYNGELMQKNLSLQESVKSLEDIACQYVDKVVYQSLQADRDKVMEQSQMANRELGELQAEMGVMRTDMATRQLWRNLDQYECHSLRHQIVDLQATSDDKAVIARLSNDVIMARMAEAEVRKKLDEMVVELATAKRDNQAQISNLENENKNYVATIEAIRRKNSHLELIIKQQRQHYFGYIPYTSEEKMVTRINAIVNEKRHMNDVCTTVEQNEFDSRLLKETLELKTDVLNELNQMIRDGDAQARALEKWFLDKTNVQLQELRCRRQVEFKEAQLKQANARLYDQEHQIAQLETELLQTLCLGVSAENAPISATRIDNRVQLTATPATVIEITPPKKIDTHHVDTQTSLNSNSNGTNGPAGTKTVATKAANSDNEEVFKCKQTCEHLQVELVRKDEEIKQRSDEMQKLKQKLLELEMSISLLRQQMGDKQSQISFYEKHILDLQQTKLDTQKETRILDQLQQTLAEKERMIFELQSLLKKDRDEHSRAAVCFQNELKELQAQIQQQEQTKEEKHAPARVAVEFYIQQVHALEKLTTELQTSVSTLGSQLQASREECGRWRTLSSDRLRSLDELRVQLEEQHKNELAAYKNECEKWRSEVKTLQLYISDYKQDIIDLRPNIEKELKDKDNKIHELLITLRQLKTELRRKGTVAPPPTQRTDENLDEVKENLLREQEVLKKRCEQLLSREKSAREEIRSLKGQLMKRPAMSSARSEGTTTTASVKEQQARRIQTLEKEVNDLREKLEREVAVNEVHKTKVSADFEKWNKLKHWQQTAEKTKVKLKEKSEECEKIQATCSSYRMLIERLERDKHNLEVRLKHLKGSVVMPATGSSGADGGGDAYMMAAAWETEKTKLKAEISTLRGKVEQQQHHSGALSSAMLQDKLEAQERKIAILEISTRGGGEVRAGMERIQNANVALQKANLRLEAESLDLRLDLEKSTNELPHLREQITYLENYIKLLKVNTPEEVTEEGKEGKDAASTSGLVETKRVAELERTVLVLKRVVEKLQVENKRLTNGSLRTCTSDRGNSAERFKREYGRLKQQFDENVERNATLEKELNLANQKLKTCEKNGNSGGKNGSSEDVEKYKEELNMVKEQLHNKGELLEKVKLLLQRANVKEKALLDQVNTLKGLIDSK